MCLKTSAWRSAMQHRCIYWAYSYRPPAQRRVSGVIIPILHCHERREDLSLPTAGISHVRAGAQHHAPGPGPAHSGGRLGGGRQPPRRGAGRDRPGEPAVRLWGGRREWLLIHCIAMPC